MSLISPDFGVSRPPRSPHTPLFHCIIANTVVWRRYWLRRGPRLLAVDCLELGLQGAQYKERGGVWRSVEALCHTSPPDHI